MSTGQPTSQIEILCLSWKNNRLFPVTGVEGEAEGVDKREGVDADHPTTTKEAAAKDEAGGATTSTNRRRRVIKETPKGRPKTSRNLRSSKDTDEH